MFSTETVVSLTEVDLNNKLIECNLSIKGNRNIKEKRLLIAFGNDSEYLIKRIDLITKYWINYNKLNINIPFDLIKLLSLFSKNSLKFTIFHENWIKNEFISINEECNEIEMIKQNSKYAFFACSEHPINNNQSFNVKIINRNENMYIGLLSDFSRICNQIQCYPMQRTCITIIWLCGNSKWQNKMRIYSNNTKKI